jgi:hypothetical protein
VLACAWCNHLKAGRNVEEFRLMLRPLASEQEWNGAFAGETSATGTWSTSPQVRLWFAPASDLWELCWDTYRVRLRDRGQPPE